MGLKGVLGAIVAKLIWDGDEARLVESELRAEFSPLPPEAERRLIGPRLGELDVLEAARVADEVATDGAPSPTP